MLEPCADCQHLFVPTALVAGVCMSCSLPAPVEPEDPEVARERLVKAIFGADAELTAMTPTAAAVQKELELADDAVQQDAMARAELARRALARRKLMPFIIRMNERYLPGWVHHEICEALEQFLQDVADGKSPRLMIFMPPRHGKSEIISRQFPAWAIGKYPHFEIIAASHTTSLSLDFSKKVRAALRTPEFQTVFSACRLDPDIQGAEQWRTTQGGGYTPVGVGSAVVGKGAHILIIDDPVAGEEDAESADSRAGVKAWYQTEAYTRLAPGGGVLIIMQRWHDDDLAGWLESLDKKGEGDNWKIIRYAAEATEDEPYRQKGEPLHPERYPLHLLARIKRNMTPRQWEALYQQNPVPDDGGYFLRQYFKYYDNPPPRDELKIYTAWDLAIGQKQTNDYTVGAVFGYDRNDDLYLLEILRGRWDAFEIVEQMLDSHKKWNPEAVGIERGQLSMSIEPILNRRIIERKQYTFAAVDLPPGRQDKQARARPIQGRMRQGKVLFPRKADWLMEFERELLRFPNTDHDDQVDAIAWIGQMLMQMAPVFTPQPPKKKSWRDKLAASIQNAASKSAMAS